VFLIVFKGFFIGFQVFKVFLDFKIRQNMTYKYTKNILYFIHPFPATSFIVICRI